MGIFQPNLLGCVLCYGFHAVRWGPSPRLELLLRRNGLIVCQNGFQVIINDDFLEEGVLRPITLPYALLIGLYLLSVTASGSRLFGSVVEHWIIDLAARVWFPPKSWDFFSA